jgi:hypothetical protein
MKKNISIFTILVIVLTNISFHSTNASSQVDNLAEQNGITHYGMPIEEIKKTYKQKDATLEVIYSKMLSDDNMDNYVKRFYDEFLRLLETWLYTNTLPASSLKIEISNCKFSKIGYCKKKNVKEVSLVLFKNDKKERGISFKHADLIDRSQYQLLAQRTIIYFLEK